jgi:hypothetical protein
MVVLEQRQAGVARRQASGGDARADDDRRQQSRAEELSQQPAAQAAVGDHAAETSLSANSLGSPASRTSAATASWS